MGKPKGLKELREKALQGVKPPKKKKPKLIDPTKNLGPRPKPKPPKIDIRRSAPDRWWYA